MDNVKSHYEKEMDEKRDFYRKKGKFCKPLQNSLVKKLALSCTHRGSCLDIGCGPGGALSLIRNSFDELYGVDIIETPEIKAKPYIHFRCADLNSELLPFGENKFDLIIASMIFEHIFDPFWLISEIERCLKPRGYLIMGVPNICYLKHLISLISGMAPRTAMNVRNFSEKKVWDGRHLHFFGIKDTKDMLTKFGFVIKSIHTSGRFAAVRRICPSLLFSDLYFVAQKIR
ncbi:MAG: class I SAM-dependent methyltransferase [Candidatus Omnitrophota bacterium]